MSTDYQAPNHSFGRAAIRLGELVMARAEAALAALELTPLAYDMMLCIHEDDGLSQQELSRKLNKYAQKMVGLIDGLEQRGLVERKVSPTDRRRHRLQLTAAGQALLQQASAVATAVEQQLFGTVPEADKARFIALVDLLDTGTQCRKA